MEAVSLALRYVVGGGGHAKDIRSDLDAAVELIEHDDLVVKGRRVDIVGINDPATRRKVVERLVARGVDVRHDSLVHSSASVGPEVVLGAHTHVGAGSTLTRCRIGSFSTIAPGVTICGDVTIGEGCFIGAGAVVCNLLTIGDNVTVGAGAVVTRSLPSDVTAVGNPARILP